VLRESVDRVAYDTIVRAGVRGFEMFCGGCNGSGFAPPTNGVSLRTTPRNFLGRSGTPSAQVYLCAPETAAASTITGVITDPRDLGLEPYSYEMPESFKNDRKLFIMPGEREKRGVIRRGPNLRPIPPMAPLPDDTRGEVLLKLGNDITTDHICPAGALYLPIRSNIPELSRHAFKVVDDTFAERAGAAGGGLIVAGSNYVQGASREQAAMVPRYLGGKAVLALDFARLHLANMVNWGLLPLVFLNSADFEGINQGDPLLIDAFRLEEGKSLAVKNFSNGGTFMVRSPLCQMDLDAVKVGGRINLLKERVR